MIKINRSLYQPDPLTQKKLADGSERIKAFIKNNVRQARFDFSLNSWGNAKELLMKIQHSKCAYCESTVGTTSWGALENFRPKSKFPELAFDWSNLLVSCQVCNANKRDQFPLDNAGHPMLVDPSVDDPSCFITFDIHGSAIPLNKRGAITIDLLSLNRPELKKERERAIYQYPGRDPNLIGDEIAYAGAIRAIVQSGKDFEKMAVLNNGDEPIDVINSNENLVKRDFSYISSISITNFRAIEKVNLTIPLLDGVPGWQVLLGENAAGKSTVLKAIAIALMGEGFLDSTRTYQKNILRRYKDKNKIQESKSGTVIITFVNGEKTLLTFNRFGLRFEQGAKCMSGTVRGYGSMRLLPNEDEKSSVKPDMADVRNLFNPRQSLVNTEKLLIQLHKDNTTKFEKFATNIRHLLQLDGALDVINGELLIPVNGMPVRIEELSDGYQAMIALVVDLMSSFDDSSPIESAPGILLLDELGTHLHPRWRMDFVGRLRSTFRGLQVISTTHEPLCLRGFKKGEVSLLRRDSIGNIALVSDDELPSVEGMRVDQILTSPFFGLHSTIEPELEAHFVRYYSLLAKKNLTKEEDVQRKEYAVKLKPHRHLAFTRRDQLMYEAIDAFLAEEANESSENRLKLKQLTMEKLRDIWYEDGVSELQGGRA